jgi:hypothetical protein
MNTNGFARGMGSFNLVVQPRHQNDSPATAWYAVGEAFQATGKNMWQALSVHEPTPTYSADKENAPA